MTARYCSECGVIFEYESYEPTKIPCPACGTPWVASAEMPTTVIIEMGDDLETVERRMKNMGTRSAGQNMKADAKRVTQVQRQCKDLENVIGRLQEVISQLSVVFRPVLAKVGGEASLAEEIVPQIDVAPLAQQILAFEQLIMTEIERLVDLVNRCEV